MKTTVLYASKAKAQEISEHLLGYRTPTGKPLFKQNDINNGFEISTVKYKTVVFRYINDGEGLQKFEYDERLLTF